MHKNLDWEKADLNIQRDRPGGGGGGFLAERHEGMVSGAKRMEGDHGLKSLRTSQLGKHETEEGPGDHTTEPLLTTEGWEGAIIEGE